MNQDSTTTKYLIHAKIMADGVIEKPDVVGAVFGQTEGLLGDDLNLRDLQKSGRIGRIEVEIVSKNGRSEGTIIIPSSLDQVETSILAASLETIDRVGPCKSKIDVSNIEDVRLVKRTRIVEKAKNLLSKLMEDGRNVSQDITESVRSSIQIDEITSYGKEKLPAGPNVEDSDAIIVVEGRSDVINLLRSGIKNTIAVEGTNISDTIKDLSRSKTVTVFVDGDRGGELILKELSQVADIDFVARAPRGTEVEELSQKQIMKCLRNKISYDQYLELYSTNGDEKEGSTARQDNGSSGYQANEPNQKVNGNMPVSDRPNDSRKITEAKLGAGSVHPQPAPKVSAQAQPQLQNSHPSSPSTKVIHDGKPEGAPVMEQKKVQEIKHNTLSPKLELYKKIITELSGTFKARLLNEHDEPLKEVNVKDVRELLKNTDAPVKTMVFDGIIVQDLLDIAESKGVTTIVCLKQGNVIRVPQGIKIIYKQDLGL